MASNSRDYLRAVPLAGAVSAGLLPWGGFHEGWSGIDDYRRTDEAVRLAMESAGRWGRGALVALAVGNRALSTAELSALVASGGSIEPELARLVDADLVEAADAGWVLSRAARSWLVDPLPSLGDPGAVTVDQLTAMARRLGVDDSRSRKAALVERIAAALAEGTVLASLSAPATALLDRIVVTAGLEMVDAEQVGLAPWVVQQAGFGRYQAMARRNEDLANLGELIEAGLVGVAGWDQIWIWREAWPALGRLPVTVGQAVDDPATTGRSSTTAPVPGLVALVDRCLRIWDQSPPPVLKNREVRLPRNVLKATARELGVPVETVELISGLVLGIGLLVEAEVGVTGRGRSRRAELVWRPDVELFEAWSRASATRRWLRLVAEWCRPLVGVAPDELANRHLVMWELGRLDTDRAVVDDDSLARWIDYRYAVVGSHDRAATAIAELRLLGLAGVGPLSLTDMACRLLRDPTAISESEVAGASEVIVQADLTVVAPPGLDPDVAARLASLAVLESDAGAVIHRLDEDLIIRAIQSGESVEEIIDFLSEISSVPLPDAVERLVVDAADRAGRVRVLDAASVVVVSDPADLNLACSIAAAKLVRVNELTAMSELSPAKLRAALDRKGLAPRLVGIASDKPTVSRAAEARARAEQAKQAYAGTSAAWVRSHLARLEEQAELLADADSRLSIRGPLALIEAES